MNTDQAKRILLLYRPGTADVADPEMAEALDQVERDRELQRWFQQHCAFQTAISRGLRETNAPEDLKASILRDSKVIKPLIWWQRPVFVAAAAAVVLLCALVLFWERPQTADRFSDFRARMVRTALREYRMDIVTNDVKQLRSFIAGRGGPSDYVVPQGLQKLNLTGGGLLRWRGNPVSMICYDRGNKEMIFLFVMDRSALRDAPGSTPQLAQVNKLSTASWTDERHTYVLAGQGKADSLRNYWDGNQR